MDFIVKIVLFQHIPFVFIQPDPMTRSALVDGKSHLVAHFALDKDVATLRAQLGSF
jgi:hypothetical protein